MREDCAICAVKLACADVCWPVVGEELNASCGRSNCAFEKIPGFLRPALLLMGLETCEYGCKVFPVLEDLMFDALKLVLYVLSGKKRGENHSNPRPNRFSPALKVFVAATELPGVPEYLCLIMMDP